MHRGYIGVIQKNAFALKLSPALLTHSAMVRENSRQGRFSKADEGIDMQQLPVERTTNNSYSITWSMFPRVIRRHTVRFAD